MELSQNDKKSFAVRAAIFLIRCYKASISRYLGGQCRFVPSCSDYAIECFEKFGFIKGMYKSLGRILRCNPLGGKGYNPPDDK
jgi:putative membrane protein insertion efficiency factor